jgi:hypothetical protein
MSDWFWVVAVIALCFIFEGEPDIYDLAQKKVMASMSETCK